MVSSMTTGLPFWMSGLNNDTIINILDKLESIITQNSITFTQLEYCRHEYLLLWMSDVFNDNSFTILNVWSQQSKQYQHSRQIGVTNILKSIIFTELEDCRREYLLLWMSDVSMTTVLPFWIIGVNNDTNINILDRVESLMTQNSIIFTD